MWWVISIGCREPEFFLGNAASAYRHTEAETGTPFVLLPDSSFSFENGLPAPAWLGLARCNEAPLDSSPHSYLALGQCVSCCWFACISYETRVPGGQGAITASSLFPDPLGNDLTYNNCWFTVSLFTYAFSRVHFRNYFCSLPLLLIEQGG